ncbi:hypothetical protein [Sphingomonas sp.]|uniref:hypothetical protein n=1 Tax=Sphingomonas sp. TaxID=28214 RepID=UPI001B1B4C0C|nr:hypothetical protein [Sphingomonas sp.]MBO9713608.1 hypothetical protein [Sphingomonas sp.]
MMIPARLDGLPQIFTVATLVFAALKLGPVFILLPQKHRLDRIAEARWVALLYFTSKLSGILAVAFALAAAASAGKVGEAEWLSALMVVAGAATFWTIYARLTRQTPAA